jgi:hypothetical protein
MKTKVGFLILGLVVGIFIGFFVGWFHNAYSVLGTSEEFRFCNWNLEHQDKLQPQLREYLKARLYWTALAYVKKGYYPEYSNFDYGPVDESLLENIECYKELISHKEVYEMAIKKHGASKAKLIE